MASLVYLLARLLWGINTHEHEELDKNVIIGDEEDTVLGLIDEAPDEDSPAEPQDEEPGEVPSVPSQERQDRIQELLRQLERRRK